MKYFFSSLIGSSSSIDMHLHIIVNGHLRCRGSFGLYGDSFWFSCSLYSSQSTLPCFVTCFGIVCRFLLFPFLDLFMVFTAIFRFWNLFGILATMSSMKIDSHFKIWRSKHDTLKDVELNNSENWCMKMCTFCNAMLLRMTSKWSPTHQNGPSKMLHSFNLDHEEDVQLCCLINMEGTFHDESIFWHIWVVLKTFVPLPYHVKGKDSSPFP